MDLQKCIICQMKTIFQTHDGTGLDHLDKGFALELGEADYHQRCPNAKTAKSTYVKKNGSVQLLENYNYGEWPDISNGHFLNLGAFES